MTLRNDENIVLVFSGGIQAGTFPVMAGAISRPVRSRAYLACGALAQEGIAQNLRLKIQAKSERARNLLDDLRNTLAEAMA